jgi:DNA-binding NarL/FixJ family response regulator
MSAPTRSGPDTLALVIPPAWQTFLRSGEYAGARASIRRNGSEVPVGLVARLEFADEHNLTIHLALADGDSPAPGSSGRSLVRMLTARERAVITLIAMGHETHDIGHTLHISPSTVRTHVRNSMAKLGAHTRAQLVAVAMEGREPVQLDRSDEHGGGKSPN